MLDSLTSPESSGSFGIVAQEEVPTKMIPLNKVAINMDPIEMDLLPFFRLLCPLMVNI